MSGVISAELNHCKNFFKKPRSADIFGRSPETLERSDFVLEKTHFTKTFEAYHKFLPRKLGAKRLVCVFDYNLVNTLSYLACSECKGKLKSLSDKHASAKDTECASALICTVCGKKYEVLDGVAYFSNGAMSVDDKKQIRARNLAAEALKNKNAGEIKAHIKQLVESGGTGLAVCFFELARALSKQGLNKPDVMGEIFRYGNELVQNLSGGKNYKRMRQEIMQAVSTARHNLDEYRGCYVLPDKVLAYIRGALTPSAETIIFEGAMGSGDNLLRMAKVIGSGKNVFGIGIDLSEKMVLEAQKKTRAVSNIFFAEGNLEKIPVKNSIADCIVLNNALDRLRNPKKVAKEFGRISKPGSVFALFNCFPLQYVSPDGIMEYVPKEDRMDLKTMMEASGFVVACEYGADVLPPWVLETLFGGKATFSMAGVVGVKKR